MPVPLYPVILLAANWNGKKSLAAKILFPSKVGEELAKFEKAYKAVQWPLVYDLPTDKSKLKDVDDQIVNCKTVFKGEFDHLKATADIAKKQAIKIRDEWSKNPLVSKDLKTYLDNIIKNFDPLLAKIDHESKANYAAIVATRNQIAAANPSAAAAAADAVGTKTVVRGKDAPKSDVLKTKFKPQPPAAPPSPKSKEKEKESSESESEESSAPGAPGAKPRSSSGSTPPPPPGRPPSPPSPKSGSAPGTPPPKSKEKESRESESEESTAPGAPGSKSRSTSTPPPPPGKAPGSPPPKTTTSSRSVPNAPGTKGTPPPPKSKEKETRESESDERTIPGAPGSKSRSTPPPPPGTRKGNESRESESEQSSNR